MKAIQTTGNAPKELLPLTLIRSGGLPFAFVEKCATNFNIDEERLQEAERRLNAAIQNVQSAFDDLLHALSNSPERTLVYQARQSFFQKKRLPKEGVLPPNENLEKAFEALKIGEENFGKVKDDYKINYSKSLLAGYAALRELAGNPDFQHAMLFASHDLFHRLVVFSQSGQDASFNKKDRQTAFALTRYATRMAAKTSPLGRFCGVGLPTENVSEMPAFAQSRTIVTPNTALLPALYAVLLTEKPFFESLQIRLNPCITAGNLPEYQWLAMEGDTEMFHQTNSTTFLNWLIQQMLDHGGYFSWEALMAATMEQVEADEATVEKHLLRLFDNGLLEWVLPVDGFSASWCGQLYQYLGFLPSSPLITDALTLLNWLRTTARILPHQPPPKARELQAEACEQWTVFFEKASSVAPPVAPEQIFYEDLEWSADLPTPPENLAKWRNDLKTLWANRQPAPLPMLQQRMLACWENHFSGKKDVDFTTFCNVFLQNPESGQQAAGSGRQDEAVPMGVLMQPFQEGGRWMAVVNGLYVGGGKLAARWLHLFPAAERERLELWHKVLNLYPFPSQGWYNANFQPQPQNGLVQVPGSRWKRQDKEVRLGQLRVRRNADEIQAVYPDGPRVLFTDLGLEAPETRSPAMQLLHQMTVPVVGLSALLSRDTWSEISPGLKQRARETYEDLVLARQAFAVDETVWKSWLTEHEHQALAYRYLCTALRVVGVQRYFFYHFPGEKPQMADQNSPLIMQVFEKDLRHGTGTLQITEMLPTPDQVGERVWELVIDPI